MKNSQDETYTDADGNEYLVYQLTVEPGDEGYMKFLVTSGYTKSKLGDSIMMKIKIPFNDRELVNGAIVNNHREIVAYVDTLVFAEERWQKHFPENARNETLFAYVERINNQK